MVFQLSLMEIHYTLKSFQGCVKKFELILRVSPDLKGILVQVLWPTVDQRVLQEIPVILEGLPVVFDENYKERI